MIIHYDCELCAGVCVRLVKCNVEKSINDRKRLAQLFLAWGSLRYALPAVALRYVKLGLSQQLFKVS